MKYSEIASALNGRLFGADRPLQGVSIDSRSVAKDELFVALKGERFNGHDFLREVAGRGASGVMVQQRAELDISQIVIDDTRLGLGRLARLWRDQYRPQLAAVTGSNGKTTVKEMLASIMRQAGETLVTQGNLNNDIGVPLTLLRLRDTHRYAVIEMGANHPGEIRYLSQLAAPDSAVITNAGPAHLEGFGTMEGVARAKAEIYEHIRPDGTAVINADDAFAPLWREKTAHLRRIEFSLDGTADVSGRWEASSNHLQISARGDGCELRLPLPGRHNARNALAAAATALSAGIEFAHIKRGLESVQPVKGRLYPQRGLAGMQILDDTYNANPGSVQAALEVITQSPGEAWLVLGDMGELGPGSAQQHERIGELARAAGIRRLFTLGVLSKHAARSFGKGAESYDSIPSLTDALKAGAGPAVNLLIKGSRTMHMEQVVMELLAEPDRQAGKGGH
ncbi:MAG TPA: UDP-N-acetylmuramoyl-tripeptide--D-alanyl-D-alanine ligase [Gammaproteobacteria bacterium]|nr:UDP-N-acetylmuramoyl-tripeptide--D-alanyl-D-alanine ligase [Gammaproteobacteria bacterium]